LIFARAGVARERRADLIWGEDFMLIKNNPGYH
jgi:hypothetical protein